jgi:hypothetical protein
MWLAGRHEALASQVSGLSSENPVGRPRWSSGTRSSRRAGLVVDEVCSQLTVLITSC